MSQYMRRLGLYRDTRGGWIAGVCAGLAARLRVSPVWVRAGFVLAVVLMHAVVLRHDGWVPIAAYFVLAFLMPCGTGAPAGVQNAFAGLKESVNFNTPTPSAQFSAAVARFAAVEARIARIEAAVTSSDLKLRRAFKDLGA